MVADGKKEGVCRYIRTEEGCRRGEACLFSHDLSQAAAISSSEADKSRPCRFFNSKRGCKLGTECPFPHVEKVKPAPAAPAASAAAASTSTTRGRDSARSVDQSTKGCRFVNTSEGCTRGAECPFSHDPAVVEQEAKRRVERLSKLRCRFVKSKAGCTRGEACPFSHDDIPRRPRSYRSDKPAEKETSAPAPKAAAASTSEKSEKKVGKCNFYLKPEGCKRGDTCPFSHDAATPAKAAPAKPVKPAPTKAAPAKAASAPKAAVGPSSTETTGKKSGRCNFYLKPEGCRRGAECPFSHDDARPPRPASSTGPAESSGPRKCRYISTAEGCRQGADCKYAH